jgi:hypothetical protein
MPSQAAGLHLTNAASSSVPKELQWNQPCTSLTPQPRQLGCWPPIPTTDRTVTSGRRPGRMHGRSDLGDG